MSMRCYNRPNRSLPRRFKLCDATRIARLVAQSGENRGVVVSTVGFQLGYFSLIDGSKFTEGEVKKEIEELLRAADFLAQVAEVLPILGITGLIFSVALRFVSVTAGIVAPIVLILLKKHEIKGARPC